MSSFNAVQALGCKCALITQRSVCTGMTTLALLGSRVSYTNSLQVTSPGMEGGYKTADGGEERMAWGFEALVNRA